MAAPKRYKTTFQSKAYVVSTAYYNQMGNPFGVIVLANQMPLFNIGTVVSGEVFNKPYETGAYVNGKAQILNDDFLKLTGSNYFIKLSTLVPAFGGGISLGNEFNSISKPAIINHVSPNSGILFDRLSNADGEGGAGGGGMWGAIAGAVAGIVDSGFKYGANKDTAKALTEQARLQGLASQIQAGYGSLGNDTSSELLAAALGNRYNQPAPKTATVDSNKMIWLALIAAGAIVAVFFIVKGGKE